MKWKMGTGSEPGSVSTPLENPCGSVPVPFFHGTPVWPPEKRDRHRRYNQSAIQSHRSTEPAPIFGLQHTLPFFWIFADLSGPWHRWAVEWRTWGASTDSDGFSDSQRRSAMKRAFLGFGIVLALCVGGALIVAAQDRDKPPVRDVDRPRADAPPPRQYVDRSRADAPPPRRDVESR